ncbi:MAG: response regulator, partial [Candidatus Eisenbacteria bacterium]
AHQNQEVERKNAEVEQSRQELEEKARQLALTSKYKSEFLANMSHELRTPLNSLLILSDQLGKNPQGNLSPKQIEFSKTIHSSGNDLLMLINDILDLSKIESGTVIVDLGEMRFDDLHHYIERTFRPVAESKELDFIVRLDPQLPRSMNTDAKRLQQIIKNLLSNAFKFTHHGRVTFTIEPVRGGWDPENETLSHAGEVLAFAVDDTGIGISGDKQHIVFEAFQQADGSTSRKYGGTGLGLAISRELSKFLGGEIRLLSTPGRGSNFTLYLPLSYSPPRAVRRLATLEIEASPVAAASNGGAAAGPGPAVLAEESPDLAIAPLFNEAGDDRDNILPGEAVLLIVENDLGFARLALDAAREKGFKGLVTSFGAQALMLTREYRPSAVTLDIFLPDMDGWRVLERLKHDLTTRHIPVCVISTEDARERASSSGALGFIAKPIPSRDMLDQGLAWLYETATRPTRHALLLARASKRRDRLIESLGGEDVSITAVADAPAALQVLADRRVDCLIVDAAVAVDPGAFAHAVESRFQLGIPVVVFDDGKQPHDREAWKGRENLVVRHVHSPERLLDQATFFLHRNLTTLPQAQHKTLHELHQSDKVMAGKQVLIVDDDMRNIFALTTVLEEHGMNVVSADNGRDAVSILSRQRDIDIVLMDIMMPEMDGVATMREVRKIPECQDLPIIAVTAKAMKGDREKCIEAGAWDYLSKPVDTERMLTVMRAWLHR